MMRKRRSDAGVLKYPDKQMIERNSVPEPNSGCWLWLGSLNRWGYGRLGNNRVERQAHRLSYVAFVGPIASELEVLHGCDVKCCVNPSHLRLGSHDDNMRDAVRRGRMRPRYGIANATAKLTRTALDEIRAMVSPKNDAALALKYGVHRSTITSARKGETYGQ
jgi:hypothetical protein